MVKMYIQLDEEKFSPENLEKANKVIDELFERVGGYKDKYGTYTNGEFETFAAAYTRLEQIEGFLDKVKIALWFTDDGHHEGDFYWEDWLEDLMKSELFIFVVNSWYLYIDGKVENLLERALAWRKEVYGEPKCNI